MTSAIATSRQPIVRPLLLACLLAIGAGIVMGILAIWLITFGDQLFGPRGAYEQLVVQDDGTPLIAAGAQHQDLRTLDGKRIPDDERLRQMSGAYLSVPRAVRPALFRLGWDERIIGWADERRPATLWYLVHDGKLDGSAYFVGFHSESNSCVGYIGASGFCTEPPPADDRFPLDGLLMTQQARQFAAYIGRQPYYGQGARTVHIISANRVAEVDLRETSVRVLISADKILSLGSFVRRPPRRPAKDDSDEYAQYISYLAIRTSDEIIVFDPRKRTQRSFAIPAELRAATLTFYELGPDLALLHRVHYVAGDTRNILYWIDPAGKIARREEVVLPSSAPLYRPQGQAWVVAAAASPPLAAAVGVPFAASDLERDAPWLARYRRGLALAWLPLTLDAFLGAAMAWLCCRRQRRYVRPWTAVWAIFVFLGGVPGLLAYLWHRRWPVFEPCPACGESVPRDRDRCARCDAEFPAPAPKGIEIFAA